jgi:hypothetical protein
MDKKTEVKKSCVGNFNAFVEFTDDKTCLEIDFFEHCVRKIFFLDGYAGDWNGFMPGKFRLSDILKFDNSFEHMTRGLITSEKFMGIGFEVSEKYENKYHFLEEVYEVKTILQQEDILISSIIIFPEFIGKDRFWDFYEPYIWDDYISNSRFL